jgi:hypothetical protein
MARPEAALLTNPATRLEGYRQIFSALPKLQFGGNLSASSAWWRGREHFDCFYFAYRPLEPGEPQLRLRGYTNQTGPLFDVIVQQGLMTVLIHHPGDIFKGPVPAEGSPFRSRYGVEPWDLNEIFLIGQRIADGDFLPESGSNSVAITDAGTTTGLREIDFDSRSGLPSRAKWVRGETEWEASYREWALFTDDSIEEQPRLMPSNVEIRRRHPRTTLELALTSYRFGPDVPPQIFKPVVEYQYIDHPLEELNQLLEN